jgi:hypothetical protein
VDETYYGRTGLNLSISNCRDQAYDGASAMAGRKSGVQTRIKEIEPKALPSYANNKLLMITYVSGFIGK